jgi:hypothetical protein
VLLVFSFHAIFAFQHVVVKTCPCVGEWQSLHCDSIKKLEFAIPTIKKYSLKIKYNKQTKVWDYEGLFVTKNKNKNVDQVWFCEGMQEKENNKLFERV